MFSSKKGKNPAVASAAKTNEGEFLCKVAIIGPNGAGKSCIMRKILSNSFTLHLKPTIGVDFGLAIFDNALLQLWDTAGQERFGDMMPLYYRDTKGIVLVYDATNTTEKSLEELNKWLMNAINYCPPVPILLLGNKSDSEGAIKLADISKLETLLTLHTGFQIIGHELVSAITSTQEDLRRVFEPFVDAMRLSAIHAEDAAVQLSATPTRGCNC